MLVAMTKDRIIVREGDEIISFRGETWKFWAVINPNQISVKGNDEYLRIFFPSVFDLTIEDLVTQEHKDEA